MSGLARQYNEWHQPASRAETFHVDTTQGSFLARVIRGIDFKVGGPARERGEDHLAGPSGLGLDPIENCPRHVTEHQPAVVYSIFVHRRLGKVSDGRDIWHPQALLSVTGNVTEEWFVIRKRNLLAQQLLKEARAWADELTAMEIAGPGDLEPAWRRLEARYGVPFQTFWSLRYRNDLKDIWGSVHAMLRLALEDERSRRARKLSIKQDIQAITGGSDEAASDARRSRAESEVRRV